MHYRLLHSHRRRQRGSSNLRRKFRSARLRWLCRRFSDHSHSRDFLSSHIQSPLALAHAANRLRLGVSSAFWVSAVLDGTGEHNFELQLRFVGERADECDWRARIAADPEHVLRSLREDFPGNVLDNVVVGEWHWGVESLHVKDFNNLF